MWDCNAFFGMGGFHPLGGIFHLLFWGALVLFIIWAVKRIAQPSTTCAPAGNEAASILDNRFARGELSAEEYRQAKRTLNSK